MPTTPIVERLRVLIDATPGLISGQVVSVMDKLALEGPKEALHGRSHPGPSGVHAGHEALDTQHGLVEAVCVQAALIRM